MSRRTVVTAVASALLLGGAAAPAVASASTDDPTIVCVLTYYDKNTGERDGFCVWVPVEPLDLPASSR